NMIAVHLAQADAQSAWHLYVVRLQLDGLQRSHRQVFEGLREAGIGVNLHYIPVHLQPYYQALGFAQGDFPEAEHYYAEAISLPIYPGLSDSEQDYVVQQVRRWIQEPSIS
ncbi:DegT/DnrJ/EryC1/StrS family aminotransferase, partial [Pseudomonas idahonensis]